MFSKVAKTIARFLLILSLGNILWIWCELQEFSLCHDDYELDPKDGVLEHFTFPWLGIIYYVNEMTKKIYSHKAPRVVLVQKQFVLAVSSDVMRLPENHKLGNVIFGDYEQDEYECGLTNDEIRKGSTCARAVFEVPIKEVVLNPESTGFHVTYSIALLKLVIPVKSYYAVPICLPTSVQRARLIGKANITLIDYMSNVPLDFQNERMGKKTLKLYTHLHCLHFKTLGSLNSNNSITHMLCTTGCGIRSGAPIIHRSSIGRFELVGLAIGGSPCLSLDMRNNLNDNPPVYVDVYPYVTWIINLITAHYIPKVYPQNFRGSDGGKSMLSLRAPKKNTKECKWAGRQALCGLCVGNIVVKHKVRLFYMEKFAVNSKIKNSGFELELEVSAGIETTIRCIRLRMSVRLPTVNVTGVDTFNVTIFMESPVLPPKFYFTLFLYGRNATSKEFLERYPLKKPIFPGI